MTVLDNLISVGSLFHNFGATLEQAREPLLFFGARGLTNSLVFAERVVLSLFEMMRSFRRYTGWSSVSILYVRVFIVNSLFIVPPGPCEPLLSN